jgi:hypothetical protein
VSEGLGDWRFLDLDIKTFNVAQGTKHCFVRIKLRSQDVLNLVDIDLSVARQCIVGSRSLQ